MSNMKLYIFITTSIKVAGGSQCYVTAKAKFLEEEGWNVLVFFQSDRIHNHKFIVDYYNKFSDCDITGITNAPFLYPCWLRNKILSRMLTKIGNYKIYKEIIIESHEDSYSQWGELLSARINAKHYVFLMNERFRGPNMYYDKKIDFYKFKYNRKEIIGGKRVISRLFDGFDYFEYEDLPDYVEIDEAQIQNVVNEKVENIERLDWNICYIGRGVKSYVPNILRDIGRLASSYPYKRIQLILVSVFDMHRKLVDEIIDKNKNLKVTELGFLHPIPQSLFNKIDVVIAGSGSARHSAEAGAIVLIADPETNMSDGILGYETMSLLYKEKDAVVSDFYNALIRVLVNKVHLTLKNKYPKTGGVKDTVQKQFLLFNKSSKDVQYYNEKLLVQGNHNLYITFKIAMHNYFPTITGFLINLKSK